jgi:ubiquinone/menaquinone biosynthesis C-methylase UbiE
MRPSDTVLEIGCGRTAPLLRQLGGKAKRLIGIDVLELEEVPRVESFRCSASNMPEIATNSVDLAFSRSVMEHIEDVDGAFKETARVLKPGGSYVFLTPNFFDYGSLIAYVVPNQFHGRIVRFVEGRPEDDTFPTFFRSNTRRDIARLASLGGLSVDHFEYLNQYPAYFLFSRTLFKVVAQYHRMLNSDYFAAFRGWILCAVSKRAADGNGAARP